MDDLNNRNYSSPSEEVGRGAAIKRFVTNPIGENCYLIWGKNRECAIIDCGALGAAQESKIADFIERNELRPTLALQTHMHFDHMFGLHFLFRTYNLQPQCHASEQIIYDFAPQMSAQLLGVQIERPLVPIKSYLTDGQTIPFGESQIQVIHTPGHTPGGLCFYLSDAKVLFSGDTLFQGSIGRSDLPGGDTNALIESIRTRLLTLPSDTMVYPGHGPQTTIGEELNSNPYI